MELTVVIPYWNGQQHIQRLLESIPEKLPVVIVDDHSDEPLQINKGNVTVIRPTEKGYFTGAVNMGMLACQTDVLILNQDTFLRGTSALRMIDKHKRDYGLIGERITGDHPAFPHGYIHGTFMYVRRDVIDRCGLMDGQHFPLWGSTADYQLRVCRARFRALPLEKIPGFTHKRDREQFGSSIKEMLRRQPKLKSRLIRTPPTISVVINCYNHGRYLADAINSLIGGPTSLGDMPGQTFQGFEIIIVDDGSTDNTPDILRELVDPWKGIHALRQQNRGSAAACNTGIKYAKGKYIAVLDADDMMRPERLERMLLAIEEDPHTVICDDMMLFRDGELIKDNVGNARWRMPEYDFEQIIHKNIMHKGILFSKKAWKDAGGYPEIMNKGREDWAFNVALGIKGYCGRRIEYGGYLYRREGQNRTLRNTNPKAWEMFYNQLQGLFPRIYAGERPMGCCGGGKRRTPRQGGQKTMATPGQGGMTLIEYIGNNAGDMTWWGTVTGVRYVFGGVRKTGFVDNSDLDGFLNDYYEGSKPVFKIAPQQQEVKKTVIEPKKVEPKPEKIVAVAEIEEPDVKADSPSHTVPDVPDPEWMTVKEAKSQADDMNQAELTELLRMERMGRRRKTLLSYLEALLDE